MAARPTITAPSRPPPPASSPNDPDAVFRKEFEGYLVINIAELDVELAQQSELFYRVAERYVEAADIEDGAKNNLNDVEAARGLAIREKLEADAAASDSKAPTEAKIKANVRADTQVIRATNDFNDARRRSSRLKVLERAYDMRSNMLRKLADLYAANWYSDTEGRATRKQLTDAAAKANRRLLSQAREAEGYAPKSK